MVNGHLDKPLAIFAIIACLDPTVSTNFTTICPRSPVALDSTMSSGGTLYSSDGRMNTKIKRKIDITKSSSYSTSIPASYVSNATKEELCLEYIKSFTAQFDARQTMKLNPKGKNKENKEQRSLYLVAENEYGVPKMVCTTIRPTLMPIPELYDMHECASFLAGYIIYEPLDPPNCPPAYLFSPTQTLDSHTGTHSTSNHIKLFLLPLHC